jgi:outer membrane protein OmpA-like peptidoglycan-associated protein
MKTYITIGILSLMGACAYAPSQAVKDAGAAYLRAEQSRASQLAPAELRQAQLAVSNAERADRNEPGGYKATDLAYIAVRKSQWAEARGDIEQARRMQESAEQEIAAATGQQLEAARKMLAEERQVGAQRVSSVQEAANAQVDEAKRIAALAEARTGEALEEVARLEKVSKDARGQVITLPSGLLFKTGKSILNAGARPRLDEVASALKRIPDRKLLIEGHTDSVGKEATNLALSERRAQAVKDYLVWRGVPAERITTVGAGPSRPIADNSNTEGRAMNRRVEIVVETPSENTARADQ